jgi:hypothetical protein
VARAADVAAAACADAADGNNAAAQIRAANRYNIRTMYLSDKNNVENLLMNRRKLVDHATGKIILLRISL